MVKKKDLPAMPFYFGDWRKAPEIRALDLSVRMIWFEMIGYMWESTERGYLTLNGNPVITGVISKMIGVDITEMEQALEQMEQFNVFSKREDGAIYCRKMIRDEEMRKLKAKAGKKGMRKRYGNNPVITGDITNTEDEYVIEIVDYLNKKTGSNYSYHARNIQQLVMDRMDEKFTVNDFKKVIDNKCIEWLNTKYAKFLRPETLFSVEHFDSYLNEPKQKAESEITFG